MIVLVDVDSTVADLMPEWLRLYNNDYSDHLTPEMITEWDMTKFVHPDCGAKIYSYLFMDTLYDNVKPIHDAWYGVQYIRKLGHRVVFVSSGTYSYPKFQWLEKHLFDTGKWGRDYIVAHDKSLVRGDMLIDDGFHNIEAFKNFYSILFNQPWNKNCLWHNRAKSWRQIVDIFRERY